MITYIGIGHLAGHLADVRRLELPEFLVFVLATVVIFATGRMGEALFGVPPDRRR